MAGAWRGAEGGSRWNPPYHLLWAAPISSPASAVAGLVKRAVRAEHDEPSVQSTPAIRNNSPATRSVLCLCLQLAIEIAAAMQNSEADWIGMTADANGELTQVAIGRKARRSCEEKGTRAHIVSSAPPTHPHGPVCMHMHARIIECPSIHEA